MTRVLWKLVGKKINLRYLQEMFKLVAEMETEFLS